MKTLIAIILTLSPCFAKVMKYEYARSPEKFLEISQHIKQIHPTLNERDNKQVAWDIYKSSTKHDVNPQIMTAIIMVESSFKQNAVSSTGDVSIVQINCSIWVPEAKRLKMDMNCKKLKKDRSYAIDRMGAILSYLKGQYSKQDARWYARYHSKTLEYKTAYWFRLHKNRYVASQTPERLLASANLE